LALQPLNPPHGGASPEGAEISISQHNPGPGRAPNAKVEDLPGFSDLPETLRAELDAMVRRRTFPAGQTVMVAGTRAEYIGCVRRGIVRMVRRELDGHEQVVGLLAEGDMFGRVFHGVLRFDKEAVTDAEIYAFPRGPFEALASRWPELDRLLMSSISNELDHARDWLLLVSKDTVIEQVAGFLVVLCRRWESFAGVAQIEQGKLLVRVPIGRTDLGSLLGARSESLSRGVHALADKGVIAIRNPREFEILDLRALLELADDDQVTETGLLENLQGR
jgi:CRP/FNR family transcriptional regulator